MSSTKPATRPASERLDSWGEIAAYLRRAVRTVQRWERAEGLPVHRHGHGKQASVYAYPVELDGWWQHHDALPSSRAQNPLEVETTREPLTTLEVPTERRRATILCATLSLDARAQGKGPEEWHRVTKEGLQLLSDAVHRFQGTVARFEDIGVVAAFGVPVALEDGVRRAIGAGMAIVRAAHHAGIHARVGIDTGPVVAGTVGDWRHSELRLTGEAPAVAKGLESRAPAGSVYVSESAHLAVHGYFDSEVVGELVVEGSARPITTYRVLNEGTWASRFDVERARGLTPFVGRSEELGVLRHHLAQVSKGRGRLVVVTGHAGMGKSRLLLELRRNLEADACRFIEGRCSPLAHDAAFSAIVDLLRSAFALRERAPDTEILERLREATNSWHRSSRSWLPYLRFLLNVDPGDSAIAGMDPAERRAGILDGVDALLAEESRERPLVVVIEDAHWLDPQSRHALTKLIDRLASLDVLLIVTRRPETDLEFGERSFVHHVSLESLTSEESRALATGVFEDDVSEETGRLLFEKTGGNPFFIEELSRSLLESGADVHGALEHAELPASIQETIQSRIDRLDDDARHALHVASVVGRRFPARVVVEHVAGSVNGLDRLMAHELIYESERFPERSYSFGHALTRDVAYDSLIGARRKEMHRAVAEAIEECYRDRIADHYEALASHYVDAEEWAPGLDYAHKAADKAAAAYAGDEADRFYGLSLSLCEKLGDSFLAAAVDIASKRGWLLVNLGRFADATVEFESMRAIAIRAGDDENQWLALANRGWAEWFDHRLAESEATCNEVLDGDGKRYPMVRFHAHMCLSFHLYACHRVDEAMPHLDAAEKLADEVDPNQSQAWWNMIGWHRLNWEGRFDETLAHLEKWRSVTSKRDNLYFQSADQCLTGITLAGKGDYAQALSRFERVLRMAGRIGLVYFSTRAMNCIGWIHAELGDYEGAAKWDARGVAAAVNARFPDPEVENNARINLGDDFQAMGLLDQAEAQYRIVEAFARDPRPNEQLDLWRYSQHLFASLGELALVRGRAEEALRYADECLEIAAPANHRKNIVKAKRLRGEVFTFQQKLEDAEVELAEALAIARLLGNPPQLWKTLDALGKLRETQNRSPDAEPYYAEAAVVRRETTARLGDHPLANHFIANAQP